MDGWSTLWLILAGCSTVALWMGFAERRSRARLEAILDEHARRLAALEEQSTASKKELAALGLRVSAAMWSAVEEARRHPLH